MSIEATLIEKSMVNASADAVWDIVGPGYGDYERWASLLDSTDASMTEDGVGSTRVCSTSLGDFNETVLAYNEAARHIAYQAEGLPPIVTKAVNNWIVTPEGENQSSVQIRFELEFVDAAPAEAQEQVKAQFGGALKMSLEELVHFAETGEPHPRKVAAMQAA